MHLSVDVEATLYDYDENEWTVTIRVGPYHRETRDEPADQEIEIVCASCEALDVQLTKGDLEARLEAYGVERKDIEKALVEAPEGAEEMNPWE